MIDRKQHQTAILNLLREVPVVAMLGARQVGKTTLAHEIGKQFQGEVHFFDLENSEHLTQLTEPLLRLRSLNGLIVLDEIQRLPVIFETLRVLADRTDNPARFLLLGSASPELSQRSSESLAGRITFYELPGLGLNEVGANHLQELWVRGAFPRAFTAGSDGASWNWRRDFVRTFFRRDIADFGTQIPPANLERFYAMLAHYHGQSWNSAEFARAFGVSNHTVAKYLNFLESTYVVRVLKPWHANISKRQVKTPKIYFRDSGILHFFLNTGSYEALLHHPKVGASWEGFIVENILGQIAQGSENAFYWRTSNGAELDLVIRVVGSGDVLRGFEIKHTLSPRITSAMRISMTDLNLDRLDVIHAGDATYDLDDNIRAVAANRILEDL